MLQVRCMKCFDQQRQKGYGTGPAFIYTHKHGSWLNMAEIELRVLNGQCLNRHLDTIEKVKAEVAAWQNNRNNKKSKINWQFTTKDARIKLKKLYPSTLCSLVYPPDVPNGTPTSMPAFLKSTTLIHH